METKRKSVLQKHEFVNKLLSDPDVQQMPEYQVLDATKEFFEYGELLDFDYLFFQCQKKEIGQYWKYVDEFEVAFDKLKTDALDILSKELENENIYASLKRQFKSPSLMYSVSECRRELKEMLSDSQLSKLAARNINLDKKILTAEELTSIKDIVIEQGNLNINNSKAKDDLYQKFDDVYDQLRMQTIDYMSAAWREKTEKTREPESRCFLSKFYPEWLRKEVDYTSNDISKDIEKADFEPEHN